LDSASSAIEVAAGDLWNWVKSEWNDVETFVVQEGEDAWHFICTIAGEVYDAILDCVASVVNAIEFVFNKIKVSIEELIAWLGFLFEWQDILRTHNVLKNLFFQYAKKIVTDIGSTQTSLNSAISGIEAQIDSWAGLEDDGTTIGTSQQSATNPPGGNSPQANWALQHTSNNLTSATTPDADPINANSSLIDQLQEIAENEGQDILTAMNQVKTEVFDVVSSLTPAQAVKKLVAIVGDLILNTAENFLDLLLDLIQSLVSGLVDVLTAPIDIPILTPIYKLITNGSSLSILDLMCLVGAIPATVIYKVVVGSTPFPDNSTTTSIINAPDWNTLAGVIAPKTSSANVKALKQKDSAVTRVARAQELDISEEDVLNVISSVLDFLAFPAAVVVASCGLIKATGISSLAVRKVAFAGYCFYCGPDIESLFADPGVWYNEYNIFIAELSIGKAYIDNLTSAADNTGWNDWGSPIVEAVINTVWLAPPIGAFVAARDSGDGDKQSTIDGFVANLLFDIGGMLTPLTSEKIDIQVFGPEAGPAVLAGGLVATTICALGYGGLTLRTGIDLLEGD
jgi:hypothetical protein